MVVTNTFGQQGNRVLTQKRTRHEWRSTLVVVLVLLASVGGMVGRVHADVYTPGGARGSLQWVIDRAAPGDTVYLNEGIHEGNIVLSKRITLLGGQGSIVRGEETGSVMTILADSCVVKGIQLEHSGRMLVGEDAGLLVRSDHNFIRDVHLRDVLFGIYLWDADECVIGGCTIAGRGDLGVGERGSGIHIYNSHRNQFRENRIWDVRDGFYIQYANRTVIEKCEVFQVRYGLHYMYADSNVFLRNMFHNNLAGAAIMYSKSILMKGNVFRDNNGFTSYGILFQDCHDLEADSNAILNNTIGMFLEASTGNQFTHNVVARNDIALQMFQNSTGNIFSRNDFVENLSPLSIVGRRTGSTWSAGGMGNYWSGYDGYDLDHDGIGDVPMKIVNVFQYLEGQNPAARLYLYSPASQALAMAARTFPILDRNEEIDTSPLLHPAGGGFSACLARGVEPDHEGGWAALPVAFLLLGGVFYYRVSRREE